MDAQTKANLLAWWLQAGVVVLVAAPLPRLLGTVVPAGPHGVLARGARRLPAVAAAAAVGRAAGAAGRVPGGGLRRRRGRACQLRDRLCLLGGSALLETSAAVRCRRSPGRRACFSGSAGSASASSPSGACVGRRGGSGRGRVRSTARRRSRRRTPSSSFRPPRAVRSPAACSGRWCSCRATSSRSPNTSRRRSRATSCCTSTGPTGCGTRSTKSCEPRSGSIRPSGG